MRQKLSLALSLALVAPFITPAQAREQIYICAQNMETNQMYHAAAYETNGAELNGLAHSSAYDPFGNFLVVIWDAAHSSIMEIKGPFSSPGSVPTNALDQDGHAWQISIFASELCR